MAFGRAPSPPATARQREELLTLLQAAGHLDFRDAHGPMGFKTNVRPAAVHPPRGRGAHRPPAGGRVG